MVRKLRVSVVLVLLAFLSGALLLIGNVPGIVGIPLILVAAAAFFFNLRSAYRLGKAMLVEYRPDAILRDTGHALLFALQDAGLMGKGVQPESVRVAEKSDGYEVSLEDASAEDAAVFIRSYRQIFAPVRDQRYLILRNEHRLPNRALRYIWILSAPSSAGSRTTHPRTTPSPTSSPPARRTPKPSPATGKGTSEAGPSSTPEPPKAAGCCLVPTLRDVPKPETWHSKSGSK